MVRSRRDINSLSPSELSDYIHAIDVLRARSAADPDDVTGYDFQAALHNDGSVGPCEHGSDLFLPWHRAHLYYFERLLQAADPPRTANVTIPYWDWLHPQATGKFPAAFSQPGLDSGRNEDPSTPLPANTLDIVLHESNQAEFGGYLKGSPIGNKGRLERGPHDYMHPNFIGGLMTHPTTAATDPIYFSFHCFIDLLWAEWQRRHAMPAPTSPQSKLRGFLTQPKHKVADFAQTLALDYRYEYTDQLNAAFDVLAPPTPLPLPPPLLETIPLIPVSGADLVTELREKAQVQFGIAAAASYAAQGRRVGLRLEEVRIPLTGSYLLRAFFHPVDVRFQRDDEEFAKRFDIGYLAMWQAHPHSEGTGHDGHGNGHPGHGQRQGHDAGHGDEHHHGNGSGHPGPGTDTHDHPTVVTARFDVTAVLAATAEAEEHLLTLQYLPSPTPLGEPQQPPELIGEITLKNILMEVYG